MSDDRAKFIDPNFEKIIKEHIPQDPDESGAPPPGRRAGKSVDKIRFDIKPEELIEYLKKYIVGQDEAVETVATKICTHFHRMRMERENPDLPRIIGNVKSNMLLIGPTGVGKTYLIKLIADKLHVPFVKGDATKFSETGYVGGDVEDLVRELVHQANDDIKLAEYGIIYIDEIDKIASSGSYYGPDVSRSGVQRNLLKLMEETEVDMKVPHDLSSQMEAMLETQRTGKTARRKVNTRNILFVMSGAFQDIPEIIVRRLKKGGMGFTGENLYSSDDVEFLLKKLHSQDLVEYGFESEFVGRLPVVSFLTDLTEDALYNILRNLNSSVILGKKRDFAAYGIDLTFDEEALRYIARKAIEHRTGARGLVSVVENLLLPFERALPSTNITHLYVTGELCANPLGYLNDLVDKNIFETFSKGFAERTGIQLEFSPAVRAIAHDIAAQKGVPLAQYLINAFKDYEYGLKLLEKDRFAITKAAIEDPKGYLDRLVKKSYRK